MPENPDDQNPDEGGGAGPDDLDDRIERIVRSVLGEVLPGGRDGGAGSDDGGGTAGASSLRSLRQIEVDAEGEVRRALAKIRSEDQAEERLSKIEQALEHVPQKMSRLKRIIWGDDEAKGA